MVQLCENAQQLHSVDRFSSQLIRSSELREWCEANTTCKHSYRPMHERNPTRSQHWILHLIVNHQSSIHASILASNHWNMHDLSHLALFVMARSARGTWLIGTAISNAPHTHVWVIICMLNNKINWCTNTTRSTAEYDYHTEDKKRSLLATR